MISFPFFSLVVSGPSPLALSPSLASLPLLIMASGTPAASTSARTKTSSAPPGTVDKVISMLASLHEKIDALPKCECNALRQEIAELKKHVIKPVSIASAPPSDMTYSVVKRALADATTYAEKASRAVWVGLPECSSPLDTAAEDQKQVEALCKELDDNLITKALADGHITHKRHPEEKGDRKKRIMKIKFESEKTRDHFLSLVRSSRPSTVTKNAGNFVRRDLCPFELEMERKARIDAFNLNCKLGSLQYGIRDDKLIKFSGTPRSLPAGYETRPPRGFNTLNNAFNGSLSLDTSTFNQSIDAANGTNSVLSSLIPTQQKPVTAAASTLNGGVQA
ncbi:hypothetical protein DXG03_002479 [Asterophora parasitica]|uniref:Uncharacterized protein n=1 Tax=Asterophora parasitica TaxID=117018 RepID=A0A9P7G3L2_9AGAR|nr:hypothetical protein DXG03_002479 [Asterophora parasitica]